jgi:hypothetical protein
MENFIYNISQLTAYLIAPALKLTGYRFDKSWRHAQSGFKYWFYMFCNTVKANQLAGID